MRVSYTSQGRSTFKTNVLGAHKSQKRLNIMLFKARMNSQVFCARQRRGSPILL